MKNHNQLTLDEKINFLNDHIYYEIDMFIKSFIKLKDLNSINYKDIINHILESFAIHARNLIEFYFESSNFPDDSRVQDYLRKDCVWEEIANKHMTQSQRADSKKRCNKY